jgi:hypothetical protein
MGDSWLVKENSSFVSATVALFPKLFKLMILVSLKTFVRDNSSLKFEQASYQN